MTGEKSDSAAATTMLRSPYWIGCIVDQAQSEGALRHEQIRTARK